MKKSLLQRQPFILPFGFVVVAAIVLLAGIVWDACNP